MLNYWFREHLYITYFLIYIFVAYVYNKVFRTRKLPVLKSLIVYLLLAIGSFMLLIFQVDARLPIIPSLAVAIFLMLLVRVRYFVESRKGRKS
jgi:membrane-associated HD superfamily phosphohydrolase